MAGIAGRCARIALAKIAQLKQELHPCVADFASFEAGLEAWWDLSRELMESFF